MLRPYCTFYSLICLQDMFCCLFAHHLFFNKLIYSGAAHFFFLLKIKDQFMVLVLIIIETPSVLFLSPFMHLCTSLEIIN